MQQILNEIRLMGILFTHLPAIVDSGANNSPKRIIVSKTFGIIEREKLHATVISLVHPLNYTSVYLRWQYFPDNIWVPLMAILAMYTPSEYLWWQYFWWQYFLQYIKLKEIIWSVIYVRFKRSLGYIDDVKFMSWQHHSVRMGRMD